MSSLPDTLLEPISSEQPCGADLSFSREFDAIQEARRFDDPTLAQGDWIAAIKDADWQAAATLCMSLLRERSKDLRLAVWLAEALTKTQGFAGLADGAHVVRGLCERYWDEVHPRPEEGDSELRVGNLAWFLDRIVQLVREVPLIDHGGRRYTAIDHEAGRAWAMALERNPALAQSVDQNAPERITVTMFEAARRATPIAFYVRLVEDADAADRSLAQLEAAIDARLGKDGPSFARAKKALADVVELVRRLARASGALAADESAAGALVNMDATAERSSGAFASQIATRQDAVAQLRAIAEFFRRTEPHSPVAYLADKAAEWSAMPLHVWLRSVLKDGNEKAHLEELLGLKHEAGPDPEPQAK